MLTVEQVDALLAPLDKARVKQKQGQSHLEAWDVRRHLLRVFGWGGWSFEVVSCECILERSVWTSEKADETHKGRHTVAYRVIGRLTIFDPDTHDVLATFEDGATGDAQNQPGFADAHDMALKTAMSQAVKRCAINLGDRFGLSLYNKGATGAVVGKSLPHAATTEHATVEAVTGGELDDPDALDGWASLEEQAEAHRELADEIKNETDDIREHMKSYRASRNLPWPMGWNDLVETQHELDRVREVEFGGPGRDGGVEDVRAAVDAAPSPSRVKRAEQVLSEARLTKKSAAEIAASHARAIEDDQKIKAAGG